MSRRGPGGVKWGVVGLGWIVAVCAGIIISPILRFIYAVFAEPPVERGDLTTAIVVISLLSGFLAYVAGGYVAGKLARVAGGANGAMTAVFGLIVGIIIAIILGILGIIFVEGVAMPPANFGLAGGALLAGLVLFLVNLLGGYVGGKWGGS